VRVGIFGGVFNPPHLGHLVCAQEAYVQLELDTVVFVPAARPPHREIPADPGAEARLTMCEYAISADERFRLSRVELDREGPSYTVDTLGELARQAPAPELVLILGADQARALARWHRPDEVVRRCAEIGVAERDGTAREDVAAGVAEVPGAAGKLRFFDMPRIDISATMIRRRAAEGRPIRYLVPDKVASYIGAQSLYGASVAAGGAA
jgi:nicotinate-nucleotide adenylyltransferase